MAVVGLVKLTQSATQVILLSKCSFFKLNNVMYPPEVSIVLKTAGYLGAALLLPHRGLLLMIAPTICENERSC